MQEGWTYVAELSRDRSGPRGSRYERVGKRLASAIDADGGYSWLISSSTSMPNDPFAQSPLVVQYTLLNRSYKNQLNALINTSAIGYAFIDELTAYTVYEQFLLTPIPLSKPKLIRGFDGRMVEPITHAIYPHLTVQDHHELTAPLLITTLGQHPIILGKPWLNRHRVLLDIESDSLVFGRYNHTNAAMPNKTTPTQVTTAPKKILLKPLVKAPEPLTNLK